MRITWPNGLIQNESRQAAGASAYTEAQRLSGSCPMIYTWNGAEFEFITDVLGVAPLGASAGDGEYFPVFVYARQRSFAMWNPTPGRYTRYGEVAPLLGAIDDRLVGDGLGW